MNNTTAKVIAAIIIVIIVSFVMWVLLFMLSHIAFTLIFLGGVIVGSAISRRKLYRDHQKDPLYRAGVKYGELMMLWKLKKAEIRLSNNDKEHPTFASVVEARDYINQMLEEKKGKPETTMPA